MHATVFRRDKLQPFNPLVALYRAAVVDSGFILGSARHPRPEGRKVAQLEIEAHGLLARGGGRGGRWPCGAARSWSCEGFWVVWRSM